MPSTIVKTIKSLLTGDTIYPVTKASAVYMNDSTSQSPSTAEGHITALDSKVGTDTLDTTAQNLCAAINQHETDISELNSKTAFLLEQKVATASSITANSSASFDITITKEGYHPIGIAGFDTQNTYCLFISMRFMNNTTARTWVKNTSSSAQSASPKITVLYQKI